jgi:3'(2'), 5'-bisphosphate nucleotidase
MEENLIRKVEELLRKAGDAVMDVYTGSNFDEMQKSDLSPVTRADLLSSRIINQGLRHLFPSIPVIDEENPIPDFDVRKNMQRLFLLDPLDGTREFIKRNGEFCINLALLENNVPVASWIFDPPRNRGWSCIRGGGLREFGNSLPIIFRDNYEELNTLRLVTSRSHPSKRGNEFLEKLRTRYKVEVLQMGSALKQVDVALGNSGIYARGSGCSEWDTAAGHLMVEETGGQVLHWNLETSLAYNKKSLINPPFVMLSFEWKRSDIKDFIKGILPFGD